MANFVDNPKLHGMVLGILEMKKQSLQSRLRVIGNYIVVLSEPRDHIVTFEVSLESLRSSDRVRNIMSKSKQGFRQAIRQAQKRFRKINNCNDISATYSLIIRVDLHIVIEVPEGDYVHLIG